MGERFRQFRWAGSSVPMRQRGGRNQRQLRASQCSSVSAAPAVARLHSGHAGSAKRGGIRQCGDSLVVNKIIEKEHTVLSHDTFLLASGSEMSATHIDLYQGEATKEVIFRAMEATPKWGRTAEVTPNCFIAREPNGQQLAYVYYESEPGRRSASFSPKTRRGGLQLCEAARPVAGHQKSTAAHDCRTTLRNDGDHPLVF
jgi:hypothetical protein